MNWIKLSVGKYDYMISDCGDIKRCSSLISNGKSLSLRVPKILKGSTTKKGYRSVELNGKAYPIHRLVAMAFIPNPDGNPQVNHIDGDKLNNCVSNLEWCTNEENMKHAYATGLQINGFGENARNFKYKYMCVEHSEFGELTAFEMANKINDNIHCVTNIKSCASNIRTRLKSFGLNFVKVNGKAGE